MPNRREGTVVVLGAGATKACGGLLTNEIMPYGLQYAGEREDYLHTVHQFLGDHFPITSVPDAQGQRRYPSLITVLSLLDMAIDRRHPMPGRRTWDLNELATARQAFDYLIFAALDHALQNSAGDQHEVMIRRLTKENGEPTVITLNYDIIADNAIAKLNEEALDGRGLFPDYGCRISNKYVAEYRQHGALYKLHGSLNWLYCPHCKRLDLGLSQDSRRTVKALMTLYQEHENKGDKAESDTLRARYTCKGSPCRSCGEPVQPVMISPTQLKDMRNHHLISVWAEAEQALRAADRVVFIGYSLPDDDLNVAYLLKRGLYDLPADRITVVERAGKNNRLVDDHPTGQRFQGLFGAGIQWCADGFDGWLKA